MATSYHYQKESQIIGPIKFRDLVKLVAAEEITAGDAVKADWQSDWQAAAEIVGLFHTAGREDVLTQWREEQRALQQAAAELDELVDFDDILSAAEHVTDSQNQTTTLGTHWNNRINDDVDFANDLEFRSDVSAAVEAAMSEINEQTPAQRRSWLSFNQPKQLLPIHTFTRWGMALLMANIVALGIWHWSNQESLRFPSSAQSTVQLFPVIGPCSPSQYFFLMGDAMLVAAGLGYGFARMLESVADG